MKITYPDGRVVEGTPTELREYDAPPVQAAPAAPQPVIITVPAQQQHWYPWWTLKPALPEYPGDWPLQPQITWNVPGVNGPQPLTFTYTDTNGRPYETSGYVQVVESKN